MFFCLLSSSITSSLQTHTNIEESANVYIPIWHMAVGTTNQEKVSSARKLQVLARSHCTIYSISNFRKVKQTSYTDNHQQKDPTNLKRTTKPYDSNIIPIIGQPMITKKKPRPNEIVPCNQNLKLEMVKNKKNIHISFLRERESRKPWNSGASWRTA